MALNPACQTFIPLLSPFVDGELTPQERVTVERHLAVCHDCTARAADLRAESGLIRHGLDLAADEVDFKDFAQKVMARLTPYKPPLLERVRVSLSEMFLYQRTAMVSSLVTAAVVLFVVVPAVLWNRTPDGYARPMMAVDSVTTEAGAKVAPVVMTTEKGDAIIWLVSSEPSSESAPGGQVNDQAVTPEPDQQAPSPDGAKTLNQQKPKGGEL
ncbi:MAG TPA: zf-HC2 domain-containing protein [Myxococcales bacterium]|nr:zf-HC2 domain-containing protein [Myxococcales bacterium]